MIVKECMLLLNGSRLHLRQSNSLNLDVDVLGKGLDGDAAASGLLREELLVLGVHLLQCAGQYIGRAAHS